MHLCSGIAPCSKHGSLLIYHFSLGSVPFLNAAVPALSAPNLSVPQEDHSYGVFLKETFCHVTASLSAEGCITLALPKLY